MPTKLVIYRDDQIEEVDLTKRDVRIGRAPENDIVVEDQGKTVSRYHAELRQEQDNYVIIDLNSQNGVWVDGQRVHRASLVPGRAVVLGKVRLVLQPKDDGEAGDDDGGGGDPLPPQRDTRLAPPRQSIAAAPGAAEAHRAEASPANVSTMSAGAQADARDTSLGQPAAGSRPANRAGASRGAAERARHLISTLARPKLLLPAFGLLVLAVVLRVVTALPAPSAAPPRQAAATPATRAPAVPERPRGGVEDAAARELNVRAEEAGRRKTADGRAIEREAASGATATTAAADDDAGAAPPRAAGGTPSPRAVTQAKLLIARSDYAGALKILTSLERTAPGTQVAQLLDQVRLLSGQRVDALLREGARLEQAGSLLAARQQLVEARTLAPSHAGLAAAIARLDGKVTAAGEDAYRRARQYDATGRAKDALALYARAVDMLPDAHPSRSTAVERLNALKGAQP